jgi:hypothetical protein
MIRRQFGDFLMKYYGAPCVHLNDDKNMRAAVIVETRDLFVLDLVLKNVVEKLGGAWNLYILGPKTLLHAISKRMPKCEFYGIDISRNSLTVPEYSKMFKRKDFWELFREETLLIFQADSLMLRPLEPWMEDFAMIGAACGKLDEPIFNGGFSIRKKSAMLKCLTGKHVRFNDEPEDVYFTRMCRKLKLNLPSVEEATKFASESLVNSECVAVHGTNKPWLQEEQIQILFSEISE